MDEPMLNFEDLPHLLDWAALSTMSANGALPMSADGKRFGDATEYPLVSDHVDDLVAAKLAVFDDRGGIKVVMITDLGQQRCVELKEYLDARYRPEGDEQ